VGLKSAVHFRAAFAPLAAAILPVDAPGLSTTRTETFARRRQARLGLYPIVTFQYSSTTLYQFSYHIQ
jgi:microcystin degradation protein MlrC